jgi:hypothetical protein
MKKSLIGPILAVIALALLAVMFVYFYISLNRLDKKIIAVQTVVVTDSSKITAIVNFFNSNLNAQTNK